MNEQKMTILYDLFAIYADEKLKDPKLSIANANAIRKIQKMLLHEKTKILKLSVMSIIALQILNKLFASIWLTMEF